MSKPKRHINLPVFYIVMILLIVVIVFVDLVISVENVGAFDFFKSLIGKNENFNINYIVFQVRLPRVFTAILVGAGLSVAGLLLQTLFHNPLAGPFVLGISSGASLGVAVFIMAAGAGMGISPFFTAGGQVLAALIGSGLVFILVLLFSWKLNDTVSLLIIGIMIGSLASSVVSILQYFANPETVHKFVIWSLGSLSSTSWVHLKFIFPVFALSLLLLIFILKPLDIMLMGEVHARVSGVNVRLVRILMIIIASLLAGTLTAFTGPIGFIGMTVPHLARLITRSISHRVIVPGVIVTGSLLMLICDIISQMPGRASVLPINAVTALFGAPVVVGFIVRNRKTKII